MSIKLPLKIPFSRGYVVFKVISSYAVLRDVMLCRVMPYRVVILHVMNSYHVKSYNVITSYVRLFYL